MISQSTSNRMKGCSIVMVILGHILNIYLHQNAYLSMILGTGGVAVFLILSGYGLAVSYHKNGIKNEYWENKIRKVFIPYWIVTFLWVILTGLLKPSRSELIIKNLFLVDYNRGIDATMWYLSFLLLWYLLFFVIFKYQYPILIKIPLLFAFGWLFYDNPSNWFAKCAWQFSYNAYSFPVGVLLGTISSRLGEKKVNPHLLAAVKLLLMIAAVAGILLFYRAQSSRKDLGQVLCFSVFVFVACFSSFVGSCKPIALLLNGVCSISYILYLVEGKWFTLVSYLKLQNDLIQAVVYTLSLVAFSVLYFLFQRYWKTRRIRSSSP